MDPFSAFAAVATVASAINDITDLIQKIRAVYSAMKDAEIYLMSLIAQLNTMKAALEQIRCLVQTASYSEQLCSDLDISLQACQLHINVLDEKMEKLETKKGGGLRFRSRVKVVFEGDDMKECLSRLDHQATALNLLISVLTSRTVTEQKALLQRSQTRRIFKRIEEDNVSVRALREEVPFNTKAKRTRSEPIGNKTSWKKPGLDKALTEPKSSRGGFSKLWRRRTTESSGSTLETAEVPLENDTFDDDGSTLFNEPGTLSDEKLKEVPNDSSSISQYYPNPGSRSHFSRMIAFGHEESGVPELIGHAQSLWSSPSEKVPALLPQQSAVETYRLETRFFDVSIQHHSIHQNRRISEDMLADYKDVSTILFAVTLINYCHENSGRLKSDLDLFRRIATDYHLWLAKIVLLLDPTGLEEILKDDPGHDCFTGGYAGDTASAVESIRSKFLQAARTGAGEDRVHVHVGEPNDVAAGAIFAIANNANQTQSNKWGGLSEY